MRRLLSSCGLAVLAGALAVPVQASLEPLVPGCTAPPPGQVAWYSFDEASGPSAADLAGSNPGNHQNGPLPVPGVAGNALDFDGLDDLVVVPHDAVFGLGTRDFSIETWIRTTKDDASIVYKRIQEGQWYGYLFMLLDGRPLLQLADGSGYTNFHSPAGNVADGVWHHVAVTVDRSEATGRRMYVDGSLVHTFDARGRTGTGSSADLRIGRSGLGWDNLDGALDELGLYSRALTAAEIQAVAGAGAAGKCKPGCTTPPARMVAWYSLDETSGSTAADVLGMHDAAHQGSPAPVPGKVGGALSLDGTDYLSVPHVAALDFGVGDFSIASWIQTTDTSGTIASKRADIPSTPNSRGWYLALVNGRLFLQLSNGYGETGNFSQAAGTPVNDGAWHHVAVSVDRDQATGGRMYVDGNLVHTFDPQNISTDTLTALNLGRIANTGQDHFTGALDEVQLFGRALTAGEVRSIHLAGSGGVCRLACVPSPVDKTAWYPFDERSGSTAADLAGSNPGTTTLTMKWVPARVDYGLSLGTSDFVLVPDDPALDVGTGDFSIEAWILPQASTGSIVSKREYSGGYHGYLFMLYDGRLLLQMADAGGYQNFIGPALPSLNAYRWRHVAVTVDRDSAGGGRMYVDGNLVYTFDPQSRSGSLDSSVGLSIGRTSDQGNFFYGNLDEVGLYKRALSTAEILSLYSAGYAGQCK